MTPVASICIPVYNGERFLGEAIAAACAQTLEDIEVVVVDNASTDRTAEIATGTGDPRVRYLRNPSNLGAEANWNRAIREARGAYVKLLCADDAVDPTCLARQVAVFEGTDGEGLALVATRRRLVDAAGQRLPVPQVEWLPGGRTTGVDALRRVVRSGRNPIGEGCAILFRSASIPRVGHFDASIPYTIDLDYWCRLLAEGDLWMIDDELASFRVTTGSWSAELASRQAAQSMAFVRRERARRPDVVTRIDASVGLLLARANATGRRLVYRAMASGGAAGASA